MPDDRSQVRYLEGEIKRLEQEVSQLRQAIKNMKVHMNEWADWADRIR